ncbi:MAG TPA: 2-dehydro-3-deoxygalactonokinase [Rhizomicrobium sp.]|jgi:2-dehydro-3-deoxygalactonokinase|nr:2-dehydro-3-deoxygalactonokinase [Rhizomicrobium sp.]
MSEAAFIAGDWGTSRLRLYLCDPAGNVLARGAGEGASVPDCAGRFAAAVAPWDNAHGVLPAVLAGMVGSSIGWREVPYLKCPAKPSAIADAAARFEADGRAIAILPGLSCRGKTGAPDVMRGEETQILGALRLHPQLSKGRHLLCLPGTHTKWVAVGDGAVSQFQTALSGELFELLRRHSVLARDSGEVDGQSPAFALGLECARQKADLLHLLFSARSRAVTGDMAKEDAASYLSGLVLGKDVATALALFDVVPSNMDGPVQLICTPLLAALYGKALATYDVKSAVIDGDRAALAGLVHAHSEIFS